MDTIGKIGQIHPDNVPTSSSHTDLVSKQEGVAPDKYHPSHRVSFTIILFLSTHQSTLEVGGARSSTFRDSYPPESHTGSPGFTPVTRESYDGSFHRSSKIDSPEVPITMITLWYLNVGSMFLIMSS